MTTCDKCSDYSQFNFCPECGHKNEMSDDEIAKKKECKQIKILDSILTKGINRLCDNTDIQNWNVRGILSHIYTIRGDIYIYLNVNGAKGDVNNILTEQFKFKLDQLENIILYKNMESEPDGSNLCTRGEIFSKMKEELHAFDINKLFQTSRTVKNTIIIKIMNPETEDYLKRIKKQFRNNPDNVSTTLLPVESMLIIFGFMKIPEKE